MGQELNFVEVEEAEGVGAPRARFVEGPKRPTARVDEVTRRELKRALEAVLFSAPEPVPLAKLQEVVADLRPVKQRLVEELIEELREEYRIQERAFGIDLIAEGYLMRTRPEYGLYVGRLHHGRRAERLSHAASEVLAIIAYKQPITRPQLEAIRGVDSTGSVHALLERGLIEQVGKLEAPGRPALYATTARFLQHFGLKSLDQLPPME